MARDGGTDLASFAQLLAELGRVAVEVKAAKVKQVYVPRRYEREGKAPLVTQGFTIEGQGDENSGTFLLTCELRGEERIAAAAETLAPDRGISVRGQLVIRQRRDAKTGAVAPAAKVLVSEVRREW